ncbi:MAG: hypothetical protein PHX03_05435, partial [Bacilli bacterium]|nr:hypothetical protein [Bacilli bacterium]
MKKKLLLLLIVLSSVFMFQTNLFGDSDSDIGEGDGDIAGSCNVDVPGSLCWNHSVNINSTVDELEAIRVSIVDKNTGTRLDGTTSVDYARSRSTTDANALNHLKNRSMYQFDTKRTKNEVIKGLGSKSYARKTGYSIQAFG